MRLKPLNLSQFTLLLSLYFVLVLNLPLATRLIAILGETEGLSLGLALSFPLFFAALFYLLFSLITLPLLAKPASSALILVSSLVSYAMYSYGTLFDMEMIRNIVETNRGEAFSYLNPSLLLWWLTTGVVPALLIVMVPLGNRGWLKELSSKALTLLLAVALIGAIAALYYKDYAAIGRNNHALNRLINPTYFLYSAGKFINRTYLATPRPFQPLGTDAAVADRQHPRQPRLLVLVVGETARAMNFELNGYARPTNAFTRELGVISFKNVHACGTATAISVPCMFSRLDRDSYDAEIANSQSNLLDVLQQAGIDVRWLDNDGGCKGVCARVTALNFDASLDLPACRGEFCFDEVLLPALQQQLDALQGQDAVVVLHLVGSHGPTYSQRYPADYQRFTPDCPRSDIQNCSDREILNTYDNTLYYNDFILSQVIATLQRNQDRWQSSLFYLSDHGESLGEDGVYLHGLPYALAPREQIEIPLLLWLSDHFAGGYDRACLQQRADEEPFSHDNLFDSVLGLMQVSTALYRPEQDIFAACRERAVAATPAPAAVPPG